MKIKIKSSVLYAAATFLTVFSALCATGCFPVLDLEPRETSDLSVRQLIRKQNKAIDPEKKWQKANSYYMKMKIALTDKSSKDYYESEIWYQHPKCFRLVTSRNGVQQKVLIYNDGRVWSVNPRTNHYTELKSDSLEYCLFLNTVRMGTPYLDYTDIFRRISVDMFIEDGVRYYRMICMSDDERIQPYIFYYDGRNFLQTKLETVNILSESGASVLYSSTIRKYTDVNGIKLPAVTVVESGGVVQVSELQEIVINKVYPESLFLPPVPFTHKGMIGNKAVKDDAPAEKKALPEKEKKPAAEKEKKWYDTFLE